MFNKIEYSKYSKIDNYAKVVLYHVHCRLEHCDILRLNQPSSSPTLKSAHLLCLDAFFSSSSLMANFPAGSLGAFLLPLRLLLPFGLALAQLSRILMVLQAAQDIFAGHQVCSVF